MLMPMLWSNNDIFDEMDNFFNDGFFGSSCRAPQAAKQFDSMSGLMRTDVIEKDDSYQLEAELPGFNKEDISIDLKNDTLTMQTYMMDSGQLYDEVLIIRHPDGTKQVIDNAATWAERIELPEKYQNRQHEIKVRRFLNKRRNREANRIAP